MTPEQRREFVRLVSEMVKALDVHCGLMRGTLQALASGVQIAHDPPRQANLDEPPPPSPTWVAWNDAHKKVEAFLATVFLATAREFNDDLLVIAVEIFLLDQKMEWRGYMPEDERARTQAERRGRMRTLVLTNLKAALRLEVIEPERKEGRP